MNNMQNMEDGKSRKKILVPLIVILLCAVSFTGAAYAYISSVTNVGNTASVEGLTIDLTEQVDDQDVAVTHALYTVKFAYGDHFLAGNDDTKKAIKYGFGTNSVGFKADGTYDSEVTSAEIATPDNYADGYYVETSYAVGTGALSTVGYQSVSMEGTVPTVDELTLALGNGAYKVGGAYTLDVTNQSGKAVTLTLNIKYDNASVDLGDGVKGIYLAITGTVGSTAVSKVVKVDAPDATTGLVTEDILTLAATEATDGTDLAVQAYVVCSDFHSASATAVTSTSYSFAVNFTAATA